jgi:hypothetical protein
MQKDGVGGKVLSAHAEVRMQQRGLSHADIALLTRWGERVQDGFVLTNRALEARKRALKSEMQRLERLRGVAVISMGDVVVTAYRARKHKIRGLLRRQAGA